MNHRLHIICERDAGLFSLVQQVIAQIPWALKEDRCPIVHFGARCAYWSAGGHADRSSVWEYYFEPVVAGRGVDAIPSWMIDRIEADPPSGGFTSLGDGSLASSHFGHHPSLNGLALPIPYEWRDPSRSLRARTHIIVCDYIRPRHYIREKVGSFFADKLADRPVIGVHARGTDALTDKRDFRKGSLVFSNYVRRLDALLSRTPDARIFLATDAQATLDRTRDFYGDRVIAYDSVRHESGEAAGTGPMGLLMPAYVASNREIAARNGEEAIIEFLLLCRCSHLVHNGSGLARTVLLAEPQMLHSNVHLENIPLPSLIGVGIASWTRSAEKRLKRIRGLRRLLPLRN
jgi:hypothetical protein